MGSTSRTTEEMSKAQFVDYGVETTEISTAPGVEPSESQKLLTGSVLDVRNSLTTSQWCLRRSYPGIELTDTTSSCSPAAPP
jgi:hypothetical protein